MLNEVTIRSMSPMAIHYMWSLIDLQCTYGGYDLNGKETRNRNKLKEYWFCAAQECGMGKDTDYWRSQYMFALKKAGFLFE